MNFKNFAAKSFVLILTSVLFSSCATLFTGTKDRITFNTEPSGATIYIDGVEQCTTPCDLRIKRSLNDTDVKIKLDGYETRLITLSKEFNVVSIINLGNLFGWGIDALSGSVMKFDQKIYDLKLSKDVTTSMKKTSQIEIDNDKKVVSLYVYQD